jgi:hypothetical protein
MLLLRSRHRKRCQTTVALAHEAPDVVDRWGGLDDRSLLLRTCAVAHGTQCPQCFGNEDGRQHILDESDIDFHDVAMVWSGMAVTA